MTDDQVWIIIYPSGDQSRLFKTCEQAISFLASHRDLQPDIKCIMGPNNLVIAKEDVWKRIKDLYASGYMP